ncbi:MAG: ABC transporter permease [Methylophilaceae bacterium]|nr:ABC transporter permease [Methylophilaceae bacterium]
MKNNLAFEVFYLVLQIFGIFTISFILLHLVPGDPILVMLGESSTISDRVALRESLGLDQPLFQQLYHSLRGIFQGDFGVSIFSQQPVAQLITEAIKNTYVLAITSLMITLTFGLTAGFFAAKNQGQWLDKWISNSSLFFISIPHFFLGPLLILLFSIFLGWLPVSGMSGFNSIILPALTLALGLLAVTIKMTRNCMVDLMNSDVVRTARAKGLSEWSVMIHHVFRLVLIPIVTLLGMQFGSLLSGAVITETIFSWDGIGKLLVDSIQTRDYPITQACILLIATSYVCINFLTEILYQFIDPRMRHS